MTLDRKLSWVPHITNLRERCQKDQRLLYIISANNWGADFNSLRRLYCALIRSKVEYAGFLVDSAASYHLKKLDRIQYAAARTMLGALKCTPTNTLEAEAFLMPLKYRRKILLTSYAARVLGIPGHPVSMLITNHLHYKPLRTAGKHMPIIGRIHECFEQVNLSKDAIASLPLEDRHTTYDPPCFTSLTVNNKDSLSCHQWCNMFSRLHDNSYSDRTAIFCDGSLRDNRSGCGIWCHEFNLKARLPDNISIFSAELFAIYYALAYIKNLPQNFILYTDSLSSLMALKQLQPSNHYLLNRILSTLANLPQQKLIMEWLPSHVGIEGNEKADALAGESLEENMQGSPCIPLPDVSRNVKDVFTKQWHEEWALSNTRLHPVQAELKQHSTGDLSRRHQVVITRLRLGTCLLTHGHHFKKSPRATCANCQCIMTLEHLILLCPAFAGERRPLLEACRAVKKPVTLQTVLHMDFPAERMIKFLEETNYIEEI